MNTLFALAMLLAPAQALMLGQAPITGATRAAAATMVAPKGAFGGSGGPESGWVGDRGEGTQVQAFEAGTDLYRLDDQTCRNIPSLIGRAPHLAPYVLPPAL